MNRCKLNLEHHLSDVQVLYSSILQESKSITLPLKSGSIDIEASGLVPVS